MAVLDSAMRALATNLAGTFGISATLTREGGSYDPDTRTVASSTATHTLTGLIEEPTETEYGQQIGEGGTIRHGDLKYTIETSSLSITPDPETDTVALDGVTYAIIGVKPVYSGEQVALFTLVLRN